MPAVTTGRRRQVPIGVAICVIVALTFAAGGVAWYVRSSRTKQIDSLAVLPFTNVGGDAKTDYLSDGITESLIDNLAHVPDLKVKSRHSVFRYKGKEVDVQQVGKDLGVAALVSGRVVPHGDTDRRERRAHQRQRQHRDLGTALQRPGDQHHCDAAADRRRHCGQAALAR